MFKESGRRAARVAACRERDRDRPWPLVSDRPDGPRLSRRCAERVWTEELFEDETSSGSHRGEGRVTDPAHATRLVLVIAPATYPAPGLGSRVIRAGPRRLAAPGVDPAADAEPVPDRLAVVDVLRDP